MPSTNSPEERQPFIFQHQTAISSASPSIVTIHRATSIGPSRSTPRPLQELHPTAKDSISPANFSKPATSHESRRRQGASHSRSSSVNGVRDGIGNLNRWSQSTTSSKGSASHRRSDSLSRRLSFGGPGAFTFGASSAQSPSKLHKGRPLVAESPPRQPTLTRPIEFPLNPATHLPPIITLSNTQQVDNTKSSPLTAAISTPSTAGLLSAAIRSTVSDYFDKSWEETAPQDYKHSKTRDRSSIDSFQPSAAYPAKNPANNGLPRHQRRETETTKDRGHSRNRSQVGKSSSGTVSSEKSKNRATKQPSQKAMLSIALQKANTAVLLDNAQNFEGAMQAYSEACNLLQQVMLRSSGDEDKRKLDAIRNTYTNRIKEIEKIAPVLSDEGKALPARPQSNDKDDASQSPTDDEEIAEIGTAMITRIVNDDSYVPGPQSRQIPPSQVPKRRGSLLASAFDPYKGVGSLSSQIIQQRQFSKSPMQENVLEINMKLASPMEPEYIPPPLSAHRSLSPLDNTLHVFDDDRWRQEAPQMFSSSDTSPRKGIKRPASVESMSWLDMIGSGGSTASSIHSRTSSLGIRRKHIRAPSGDTEAEFDAALDAAVEAAYDDGFEPMGEPEEAPDVADFEQEEAPIIRGYELEEVPDIKEYNDEVIANVRRRVEQAKERVRQTAREAEMQQARDRERARELQEERERYQNFDNSYDANESEEEERMLDEMTKGYIMDDFEFGLQSKSALPRESDSSGFSGRTWNSSIGSNPTTAGTSLSTVAETSIPPEMPSLLSKSTPPLHPPPAQALPHPPAAATLESSTLSVRLSANSLAAQGVRSRRLSGQNPKQLKIETVTRVPPVPSAPLTLPPSLQVPVSQASSSPIVQAPLTAGAITQARQPLSSASVRQPIPHSARQASSPFPGPSPSEIISPPTPTLPRVLTKDGENGVVLPRSGSPGRAHSRSGLRKNFSSSSLKNMKNRSLSVDDGSDASPNTPLNNQFIGSSANKDTLVRPAVPTLPDPVTSSFRDNMNGLPTGGLYLFDSDINTPESPSSPGVMKTGAPIPLEPCPTDYLLRPFWLMRAFYQTITHPRGGYLSTKLFVPRDVWGVKGVKIKYVEDKISNCDYLTAALQKLAQVDTCDADAVLVEMQCLESVLEQVQAALTKKLGNEVGVQSSSGFFKDAPTNGEGDTVSSGSKTLSQASKPSSFSWKRLRSKNSTLGMANNYSSKTPPLDGLKEGLNMSTLPMTSLATIRFAKRDVSQLNFSGPHANYMGALARLFDAAQVIDQIARQVEDPGLRHADKTQVGLELSTRHAAEFFGFYVCRFVLTDISLLIDKFIKRGSEWVLV